jgi:CheY-like chemotaxis protein
MEAVGQLAGGIAHDFNNVLTVVAAHARFLREALDAVREGRPLDPMAGDDLALIEEAVERASALTRQLLVFSRRQPMATRPVPVDDVVHGMERILARTLGEDIEIVARYGARDAEVLGDPGRLEQVVLNLVVNARDAMPDGGVLVIETAVDAAGVRLEVTDTGHGMDEATQARVFEPFFTTKAPGKGTGIGLATVYGIVTQMGGTVQVRSAPGRGTTFALGFPRHVDAAERDAAAARGATAAAAPVVASPPAPRPAPTPPSTSAAASGGAPVVLLVEDEAPLRSVVARMLTRQGFAVREAPNGAEALEAWRAAGGPEGRVTLVLSDVTMPGMGGDALAAALLAAHPAQRILLMTGYTDRPIPEALLARGVGLLEKPFESHGLRDAVRVVLQDA